MKNWYESKTVWINVITFLLLAAALFLPGGEFADFFSPLVVKYIALFVSLTNLVLRVWFTNTALK